MNWDSRGAMGKGDCLELIVEHAIKTIEVGIVIVEKMIVDVVGIKQL